MNSVTNQSQATGPPGSLGEVPDESAAAANIARVAARLFAVRGYDATSVRDICEAAGVTKPTLYYYFASKQALAEALLTQPLSRLVQQMWQVGAQNEDPVARLAALIEAQFDFCREDPDRARFAYAVFFGPSAGALSSEMAATAQTLRQLLEEGVKGLLAASIVREPDAPRLVAAVRGLVTVHTMDHLYRGDPLETGLGLRLVNDLIRGFGPRH